MVMSLAVKLLEWRWWKKENCEPDRINWQNFRGLEKEYVTTGNYTSVQWNRENMRQVLHRERAKNWPNSTNAGGV